MLNIMGMCHGETIMDHLSTEKNGQPNDGMWARYHVVCPEPLFPLMNEIVKIDATLPSLERLVK